MKSNTPLQKWCVSNKPGLVSVVFLYYFPLSASWLRSRVVVWCQDHTGVGLDAAEHRNNVSRRSCGDRCSCDRAVWGWGGLILSLSGSVATRVYVGGL